MLRRNPEGYHQLLLAGREVQMAGQEQEVVLHEVVLDDEVGDHQPGDHQPEAQGEQGADDAPAPDPGILQLANAIAALGQHRQHPQPVKPPKYEGVTDVNLFIDHFASVIRANNWNEELARINLRTSLKGKAADCGRGATVALIYGNLRARFGMTAEQAGERLEAYRRDAKVPLAEFADEVVRLIGLAYPTTPAVEREQMALAKFKRSVGDDNLSDFLMARHPETLIDAIAAAEVYTGRHKSTAKSKPVCRSVDTDGQAQVDKAVQDPVLKILEAQSQTLQQLLQLQQQMMTNSLAGGSTPEGGGRRSGQRSAQQGGISCYGCGGPHMLRNCPNKRRGGQQGQQNRSGNSQATGGRAGNAQSPSQ